jgi:NAD(P)-dependent dehydrogenase (short-subunit alcohol dehydrogenase family)
VNNAGGGPTGPALQATQDDVHRAFGLNVFASLYMAQATVPVMPRGGRIINIGSIASKLGMAPIPLYSASKAAGDTLSFVMATEVSTRRQCNTCISLSFPLKLRLLLTIDGCSWDEDTVSP